MKYTGRPNSVHVFYGFIRVLSSVYGHWLFRGFLLDTLWTRMNHVNVAKDRGDNFAIIYLPSCASHSENAEDCCLDSGTQTDNTKQFHHEFLIITHSFLRRFWILFYGTTMQKKQPNPSSTLQLNSHFYLLHSPPKACHHHLQFFLWLSQIYPCHSTVFYSVFSNYHPLNSLS